MFTGLDNFSEVLADLSPRGGSQTGKFGISENDRQLVVEVVGDPPGELPDGLELLGMTQLFFQPAVFGYVHGN